MNIEMVGINLYFIWLPIDLFNYYLIVMFHIGLDSFIPPSCLLAPLLVCTLHSLYNFFKVSDNGESIDNSVAYLHVLSIYDFLISSILLKAIVCDCPHLGVVMCYVFRLLILLPCKSWWCKEYNKLRSPVFDVKEHLVNLTISYRKYLNVNRLSHEDGNVNPYRVIGWGGGEVGGLKSPMLRLPWPIEAECNWFRVTSVSLLMGIAYTYKLVTPPLRHTISIHIFEFTSC